MTYSFYKEQCKKAIDRDPKTYASVFNEDGSRKPLPRISPKYKKVPKQIPCYDLKRLSKDGWRPRTKKPELQITGTEIRVKGRKLNLAILEMPNNLSKQEYNRIWMHNSRVRQKIKMLKEKYGTTVKI